ncbi:MAG TPA: RHS repeat-associated core domain-containing protein, partial [Chitinophagaceae bacterium]|nr:RHS repeat-associated core domain-containing protein [Chitinophagaceae bacterium]
YTTTNSATNNSGANPLNSFVNSLTSVFGVNTQVSPLLKNDATTVTGQLSGNSVFTTMINPSPSTSGSNQAPKAYLNVLFFDDQFKFDAGSSVVVKVAYAVNSKQTIDRMFSNAITANKSGYVYIYFSNESETQVYFDNFMLTHERGSLTEETHYYPFGLTMAGISSKAAGSLDNKYEYNGQEIQEDFDIDWYQYKWRNYDPQIGRFFCVDPLAPKYEYLTPYQFASNNPISMRELEGLEGIKFQEVDENGNLQRHVVQQTVYVVVVDKWDKKGTGRKEPKDRVESSYTSADVATVKEILNSVFNGSEGTGATNSAGETVFFDFNVQELRIGSQDATTETQLINRGANELATQSGEVAFVDANTGETVYKKSPANILLGGGFAGAYAEGANNGVRTRLSDGKQLDYGVQLHEMLHQLTTRPGEGEHALGGGLATPAESLNTRNVNAALQDALKSVTPVRVKKK